MVGRGDGASRQMSRREVWPWQWLYHSLRLPFQPVLVWLPLFATGVLAKEDRTQSSRRK
jgi:hypothetical protein